jgi:hypothetical protein
MQNVKMMRPCDPWVQKNRALIIRSAVFAEIHLKNLFCLDA